MPEQRSGKCGVGRVRPNDRMKKSVIAIGVALQCIIPYSVAYHAIWRCIMAYFVAFSFLLLCAGFIVFALGVCRMSSEADRTYASLSSHQSGSGTPAS